MTEKSGMNLPYFAAAGRPAQFFAVSGDITTESALEGASMFLDTAISLGNNPEELDANAIFASRYLAEMAKALVDTVVSRSMESPRGLVQAESWRDNLKAGGFQS